MTKHKFSKSLRNWLDSKSVVVAGYFDDVKGVNLSYLLESWVETMHLNDAFACDHPYAADYFQVAVVDKDDPRLEQPGILLKVLNDFRHCRHLKVWSGGELMDSQEIVEIMERTDDLFHLEPLEPAPWD
jgi:hypothetical protein